jgi:hypothetical protein
MAHSAESLYKSDPTLKDLPFHYSKPASHEAVEKTKKALEAKSHKVTVVNNKHEALEAIKKIIPKGASVMNAGSTTLQEIGFVDYLKTQTEWDNLHGKILAEPDHVKQAELRRQALLADYYLSSVSGLTEDGEFTACDLTGTRVGAFIQAAGHVLLVVGSNKIVKDLQEANNRQEHYCLPLESARARIAYAAMGVKGSSINNAVAIRGPNPWGTPGRYHVIIVQESLGF